MVKQLIYKSQCNTTISTEMVDDILLHAHRCNANHKITGLLLFSEDVFLQLLEGPPDSVDLVFGRICNDDRHREIDTLYTGYADQRAYPTWQMMAYSRQTALTVGLSDAFIIAANVMDPIPDVRTLDIGAFMKSFCDDFLPQQPPDRSTFN